MNISISAKSWLNTVNRQMSPRQNPGVEAAHATIATNNNKFANKMRTTIDKIPQWTLGQLINELSKIDATDDCWVSFAFGDLVPTKCSSWRGSYDEIAIGFDRLEYNNRPMLKKFLQHLRNCVGETFIGYKGGEFKMDESTPIWVANYGRSDETGVVGLATDIGAEGKCYRIYIRTDCIKF